MKVVQALRNAVACSPKRMNLQLFKDDVATESTSTATRGTLYDYTTTPINNVYTVQKNSEDSVNGKPKLVTNFNVPKFGPRWKKIATECLKVNKSSSSDLIIKEERRNLPVIEPTVQGRIIDINPNPIP